MLFTYAVVVRATKSTEQRVSLGEVQDALIISGQEKLDQPDDAMVVATLSLGNLVIGTSNVKERKVEKKDNAGKVVGVDYFFSCVVEYSFEASYVVQRGTEILAENKRHYDPHTKLVYSSAEYTTRKEAADFWSNNRDVLIPELTSNNSLQAARSLGEYLSGYYGFPIVYTRNNILWTMHEKKHDENINFQEHCNALKTLIEAMTPEVGLDATNAELIEIIDYFKSIPEKYTDPKHKADTKLRYAAYYILSKIYYNLDDPINATVYAEKLVENGYDAKDGKGLIKDAEELTAILNRTTVIKTRHFYPEDYK
ncbi:hypothetical protein FACS1894201_06270 [Bacteroidia bacterium]|nr:hypothetical protein FACS1894201_06270 [Bacteroidia bacterium]